LHAGRNFSVRFISWTRADAVNAFRQTHVDGFGGVAHVLHQPCVRSKGPLIAQVAARKGTKTRVCARFCKEAAGVQRYGLSDEHDVAVLHTGLAPARSVGEYNRGHTATGGQAHSKLKLHATIIFIGVHTTAEAHNAGGAYRADEKFSCMTRYRRDGHAGDAGVVDAYLVLNAVRELAETTAENKSY
jgi:hypothetical protein